MGWSARGHLEFFDHRHRGRRPGCTLIRRAKRRRSASSSENLNLSPEFKERLLGYDDKTLAGISKANDNTIYEDVTGAQKRSVESDAEPGDRSPPRHQLAVFARQGRHQPQQLHQGHAAALQRARAHQSQVDRRRRADDRVPARRQQYPSLVDNAEAKTPWKRGAGKEAGKQAAPRRFRAGHAGCPESRQFRRARRAWPRPTPASPGNQRARSPPGRLSTITSTDRTLPPSRPEKKL